MERKEMKSYLQKHQDENMCVFLKNEKMLYGRIVSWDNDGFTIKEIKDKNSHYSEKDKVECYVNMDFVMTIKVDDPMKSYKNPPRSY